MEPEITAGTGNDNQTSGDSGATAPPAASPPPETYTRQQLEETVARAVAGRDEQLFSGEQAWIRSPAGRAWLDAQGLTAKQAAEVARETARQGGDAEEGFDAWLGKQPKSVRDRLTPVLESFDSHQAQQKYARFNSRVEALVTDLEHGKKDSALRRQFLADVRSRILDDDVTPEEAVQAAHKELEQALAARDKNVTERTRKERMNRFVTPGGQAAGAENKEPEDWDSLGDFSRKVHRLAQER